MAVVTMTRTPNGKAAIIYCLGSAGKKGHDGVHDRNELVTGYNVIPCIPVIPQFEKQWLHRLRKNHNVEMLRIIQAFSSKELNKDNPNDIAKANMIGVMFLKKYYPNCLALVFTQADSACLHNHILVCDRDIFTHKGCDRNQTNIFVIRQRSDNICKQFFTLDHGRGGGDKLSKAERVLRKKNEDIDADKGKFYILKDDIRKRIIEAMNECISEADFYSKCTDHGLLVEKKYNKREDCYHFTYVLTDLSEEAKEYKERRIKKMPYLKKKGVDPLKFKAQSLAYNDYYDYGGLIKHLNDLERADESVPLTHVLYPELSSEDVEIIDVEAPSSIGQSVSDETLDDDVLSFYDYLIGNNKAKKPSGDKHRADMYYERLDKEFADNNENMNNYVGALEITARLGALGSELVDDQELYDLIDEMRIRKVKRDNIISKELTKGTNVSIKSKRVDHDIKIVNVDAILRHGDELNNNSLTDYDSFTLQPDATSSLDELSNISSIGDDDDNLN